MPPNPDHARRIAEWNTRHAAGLPVECSACHQTKPAADFYRNGYRRRCRLCCRTAAIARDKAIRAERKQLVAAGVDPYDRAPATQRCSRCRKTKPARDFSVSLGRPRWINSHCKLCDRAIRIKSVYRLPDGEYERLLEAQGGRCAICDQAVAGTIAVDHDHATGKVRGLLCSGCNTALGVVEGWYAEHRAAVDAYLRDRPRLAAARHDPAVAV